MKKIFYIFVILFISSCVKTLERTNPLDGKTLPIPVTNSITGITSNSANAGGYISNDGGLAILDKGVVYNTSGNPTTISSKISNGSGSASFSSNLSNLEPNTTYFVRAYAENLVGIGYGSQVSFKTSLASPAVSTTIASNITTNSFVAGGNVSKDYGTSVTARGVVWSIFPSPVISLTTKTRDSSGLGTFVSNITGLNPLTTYYYRAYATNNAGTSYGTEYTTKTLASLPSVSTTSPYNISMTSANSGGLISSDGGAAVTARGIVWGTSTNPTIALSTKTSDGTGTGTFVSTITGLSTGVKYYLRAYATNSTGTAYGNEVTLTTSANPPTMGSLSISNISSSAASLSSSIISFGGSVITEYGFVWNNTSNPSYIGSNKILVGTTTNGINSNFSFTQNMSSLTSNTRYYVKAYALNNAGVSYSTEASFTTSPGLATVTTSDPSSLTSTSVILGGNASADGGSTITQKGIVFSLQSAPTISLTTKSENGSGTGSFSATVSGLSKNTKYYYRAYATNSVGTVYGTEKSFTTNP